MKNSSIAVFRLIFILTCGAIFMLGSCSKDGDSNTPLEQTATVSGRVVTPSGKKVAAATIKTGIYSTTSSINGEFILTCESGINNLVIQTGEGRIFKTTITLNLNPGQHLVLSETETVLKQVKDLAYIAGDFDSIQVIIIDSLGYNATPISVSTLNSLPAFSNFGGLFLNCGLLTGPTLQMDSTKYLNLMDYIVNYGSIYASDFAVECLTGDGHLRLSSNGGIPHQHNASEVEKSATVCVSPLLGGFIPDSALCTQRMGMVGNYYDAVILDPNMITAVGNDSLDLFYDLYGWEVVHSYDTPFIPFITHATMGVLALKADLNTGSATGGIYFTTFHNYPQGMTNEVEAILNYIILNL